MSYYKEGIGASYDGLIGGVEFPVDIRNVSVTGSIVEGDLLAGTAGVFTNASSTADTVKPLCIAYEDYDSTDTGIISCYFAGKFNREHIGVGSLDIADFEESLRKSNIILTSEKEL